MADRRGNRFVIYFRERVRIMKKSYVVIHARETNYRELGLEGQPTKTV